MLAESGTELDQRQEGTDHDRVASSAHEAQDAKDINCLSCSPLDVL